MKVLAMTMTIMNTKLLHKKYQIDYFESIFFLIEFQKIIRMCIKFHD